MPKCFLYFCPLLWIPLLACITIAPEQQPSGPTPGPPDAAQQQALDKIAYAVKLVFNKLNSADWTLRRDYYDPHAIVNYWQQGAPMNLNNNFERIYDIKAGSPAYQKIIQPLEDQKKSFLEAKQYDSVRNLDKRIRALSHFEVYANINMASVNLEPQNKRLTYATLHMKGCTYGCLSNTGNTENISLAHYHLLFGAWDLLQCSGRKAVHFKFRHAVGTPFIENLDIEIIGDNECIRAMLDSADWNLITQALSN